VSGKRSRTASALDIVAARGSWAGAGATAARSWLEARGVDSPPGLTRWHAEIFLDRVDAPARLEFDEHEDSRFHIDIYSEEWGFYFCHLGRVSWIRITDIPFVHGRDDHSLLSQTPALENIGALLRSLEKKHDVTFYRQHALVRTNVVAAETMIRSWLQQL
jgi:hypothetical protein